MIMCEFQKVLKGKWEQWEKGIELYGDQRFGYGMIWEFEFFEVIDTNQNKGFDQVNFDYFKVDCYDEVVYVGGSWMFFCQEQVEFGIFI